MTSHLAGWEARQDAVPKGTALVVGSDASSYALLSASLSYLGYDIQLARDFIDAQEKLLEVELSLVVIEVSSDSAASLAFTRKLKKRSQANCLPILAISEKHNEEHVFRCIEAGADDFIAKPFSVYSLKSRLLAMAKSRALHRELEVKHLALSRMQADAQMDQTLAKRIFKSLITDRNNVIPQTEVLQRAAAIFCGDLVLCAFLPNGGIRVLVGDFTGHGLAAALGAIPVSNIFHTMTFKGAGDFELLAEINARLHELLPTDLFMAACMISLEAGGDSFCFWNGGMPSVLLIGDRGVRALKSFNLPLGITERLSAERQPIRVNVACSDRLIILSDGVSEAENAEGEMFGDDAIFHSIGAKEVAGSHLKNIMHSLDSHTLGAPQADDITGVEIALWELVRMDKSTLTEKHRTDYWAWKITLENDRLASVLPVQNLLRESGLLAGCEQHMAAIGTIVDELYHNALDHGVLRLDSRTKDLKDGFCQYYEKRDALLAGKIKGKITVALDASETEHGKQIVITVSDSGSGFNYSSKYGAVIINTDARQWGKGLKLVEKLSDSLVFSGYGNVVTVTYTCREE